ncbi:hypothetical protein Emtol_2923 [Emticicia oligotrophica DSM 17448]|uniref:DUF5672 domain-containing protein n=1 Tax=Emticicia oligotrophica (strain DSM 17448 / CIP 109782 / MTCC 6937 / GPTSA100-15) TaxID=929562 RepID=A0ABM5N3U3_EMTOG|nr:DUF5672 family protein [Emticicia oligotrophica]AFK04056.1 hypothetical protein Emtol_2923 [Emticicia oligotrophica DSM 17448]
MNVCVIIPIYQDKLSQFEQISLSQGMRVLGHYPIIVVKPQTLNLSLLQEQYPQITFESFDDSFFKSTLTYNRLLLSEEFYSRFLAHEFMLIYQLDAFVFRDELEYWCQQGYDYIGAPWRIEIDFDSKIKELIWHFKRKIALWFDLKEELHGKYGPKEIIMKRAVGNGGFSLRRTKKLLSLIPKNKAKIEEYLEKVKTHPAYNEDMFWGIEMNRFWPNLRIPNWRTALKFGVEHLPQKAFQLNGGLPFGCHAWDIYETEFWKKEIEKFGYKF